MVILGEQTFSNIPGHIKENLGEVSKILMESIESVLANQVMLYEEIAPTLFSKSLPSDLLDEEQHGYHEVMIITVMFCV